jgi:Uma2 family endonuclease
VFIYLNFEWRTFMSSTSEMLTAGTTNGNSHHNSRSDHPPHSADGRLVSEADYWALYYDRGDFDDEWNNGRLERLPMTDYAQFRLYLWFLSLVKDYFHVYPIGRMIGLGMGFRLALPDRTTIRKPDLAAVLDSNPIALEDKDRSYRGIFDLCIESISDATEDEVARDTVIKRAEYAAAGVRECYILDERRLETAFYRLNSVGVYVPIAPIDGVIRSHVLPGFQFRLIDLYRMPDPPQLVADDVYNHFISPYLQAERERAELAIQRAEQEQARAAQEQLLAQEATALAQQERARAERYAAKLVALGIAPDDD